MNPFTKIWQYFRGTAAPTNTGMKVVASSSTGYDAGGQGRRAQGWNASPLGPNTLLVTNLPTLIKRSRDAIRNSAVARSAIDKWESNVIGSGIQCHWMHPDEDIRKEIQKEWDKWIRAADFNEQLSFYGMQSLVARELFEAGECFARFHVTPIDGNIVPLQIQLIESEQCPVFRNVVPGNTEWRNKNFSIKSGIVFDPSTDKRVGYSMYKGQPYDTMFDPMAAAQFIFIPKEDCVQVMRPLRAGQLRGEPQMTAVLALLYEIESYADAERVRKKVAAMFAGFIHEPSLESNIFPTAPIAYSSDVTNPLNMTDAQPQSDPGTELGQLQPGTLQKLLPGEEVTFPQLPESGDYSQFMHTELHKFAAGCGLTYEALTMDLRGVNYSSIRAGMLEFRRACEAYQKSVIVHGFVQPVMRRWLKEAVLSGVLELPDYFDDPAPYEAAVCVTPGWSWVDPEKEVAAYQASVRNGFTSRTQVVREQGFDPEIIDAQQAAERKHANELGLVYDSDPNKVLIGRETLTSAASTEKTDGGEESTSPNK